MKTKVRALTQLAHGRVYASRGDEFEVTKLEAEELAAAGLVSISGDADQPAQETKMQDAGTVENKMDAEPENKSTSTRKKGA